MPANNNEISLKEALINIKKNLSNRSKNNNTDNGLSTSQLLMEETPYEITPSFIKHNGKSMAILNFYVRPSSNRTLSFQDVLDLIPISTLPGVEIHLMSKDMIIKGQEKRRYIKKNAKGSKKAMIDSSNLEKKKNTDDKSTEEIRKAKMEDYDDYELILDSSDPLMLFKWLLIVIGEDDESVDEQIEIINTLLDQNHEGARWDSLPGEQGEEFRNLFGELAPNIYDHTSTSRNYAGLSFALNAGIMDPAGMPIGVDALSLSGATAFFDFDKSTTKQAFIFAPKSSKLPMYVKPGEFESPTLSSIAAQAAANQITMAGNRAHHIVLNNFDYFDEGRYFAPAETRNIFKQYDVNSVSINPLQGFGTLSEVKQVYDRLILKIVNIFKVLMNFNLDTHQESAILGAIEQFYYHHQLWTSNADINPEDTRIVDIQKPETYPTLGLFLNEFTSMAKQAIKQNRENKADNYDALEMILKQALTTHMSVIGRTTTIQSTNAPQVFYNFKNISSLKMRQIQLLNLMDYIIHTAKQGDVIVIHGFDNISATVAIMLTDTIKAAQNKGIRFIFAFDSIIGATGSDGKMNDVFELKPSLYRDLDNDADWSFVGTLTPEELPILSNALNQALGPTVEQLLLAKVPNQVLVHRKIDKTNNFIRLAPIL